MHQLLITFGPSTGGVIHRFPLEGRNFSHAHNCDLIYDRKPVVQDKTAAAKQEEEELGFYNRDEESLEQLNR